MKEEKKLTDDKEVIRLLEIFASDNEPDGVDRLAGMALDLIRRLQYGYSSASKASEEWRAKYEKEREENAELQKQVDQLTIKNENAQKALHNYLQPRKEIEMQTAKDTAKKYHDIMEREFMKSNNSNFYKFWCNFNNEVAKQFGVEVE